MVSNGWIKLHRRFISWEWYTKPDMVSLFVYLLLAANREAVEWRGVTIERGQLLTSVASLSEATGISVQTVRNNLKRMKSTNEITIKSTNKYSIITICNYERYQFVEAPIQQAVQQAVEHTKNEQTNNKQEYKTSGEEYIPTPTTPVDISLSYAPAQEDGRRFTLFFLPKEEIAAERRIFYEIFFLAGSKRPDWEVDYFINHNEKFGWRSKPNDKGMRVTFATREQRAALAHEWTRDARFRKDREPNPEVLEIWKALFNRVVSVRPDLRSALVWKGCGMFLMPMPKKAIVFCPKELSCFLESEQGKKLISDCFQPGWTFEYQNKHRIY